MREQNLEKLFNETFSNFEADVNPNAWSGISAGLQSPVPAAQVAGNAVSGGKTIGLWGYAGLLVATSAVVISVMVYNSDKKSSDEIAAVTNSVPAVTSDAGNSFEPVVLSEISSAAIKSSASEKYSASNIEKQELAPAELEKKESAPAEKQNSESSPSNAVTATTDKPENTSREQAVPEKTSANESSPVSNTENTPSVTNNSPVAPDNFVLMVEAHDNNSPREQESRSDFTFYIPTVFTPNGDVMNDDFSPMGLNYKDYELVIYDGKSNEIFRSKDIEHKWDGKLKDGTPAPVGFYVYVISVKDLNNVEHPQRGQLLLKR